MTRSSRVSPRSPFERRYISLLTTVAVACSNCIKYGAECPGYEKGRKFVTYQHAVRPRGQRQQRSHEAQLSFSSDSTSSPGEASQSSRVPPRQASMRAPAPYGTVQIPSSLRESAIPFMHNIMGELLVHHPREDLVYASPWFTSLLDNLGRSPVLDTAMAAYLLQLVGKSNHDEGELSRSRDLYGQSLYGLQRALNHPVAWRSTETLAATMICCAFEVGIPSCCAYLGIPVPGIRSGGLLRCCLSTLTPTLPADRRHKQPRELDDARCWRVEAHRTPW